MEFNKAYNRQEFVHFLQHGFLPDDFVPTEETVIFHSKMTYSTQAVKLGTSAELDLVVYEVKHTSKNDARVSLSKEAFRMLADEMEDRALVIFVPEDNNDNYRFSLIEITLDTKEDSSRITRNYSNPRRYSYFLGKGIAYYTPKKYLDKKDRVINADDLRSRFSVEVLTKEFYNELSDWYAWAIKIIRFPNEINDKEDDDKFNNEGAIRLITRLIFVWFLKQRHLIPEEFFDENYLKDNLLKDFKPYLMGGLLHDVGEVKYYTAILQNLFFAMLNSPITPEGSDELSERHFRKKGSDYDNNKLMRYEYYFKNPQLFIDLANKTVPFLNGGLFDCLDTKDNGMYYDGFSDSERSMKSLYLPDFLFFIPEADVDLSVWYNDKKKKIVKVRGLINILKNYNFTVEENTPFDQEVSLDPELLGKVFENLLASYNPETQTTARKQTGSFYTPREIVQYMVNESLVAHLKRTVGEELEPQFRQLMQYSDDHVELSDTQRKSIMQSLYNCKILDPACGSGAFPMGILQQMVHILNRIDPGNTQWKEMMLSKAINETSEAYRTASSDDRKDMIADIERSFDENINRPDYARKLYLIENCIYGVDIQPIAIQISKLRFFISLVVDQKTNNNPADNFGIRPLPNLEAKFVAANTLIGLNSGVSITDTDKVCEIKAELKTANHKIFGAKTVKTKRKYKERIKKLRISLADELNELGFVNEDEAQQLASWDMFNQNTSSSFFDSDWMFGVKDGFDIVIGNPPYSRKLESQFKKYLQRHYVTSSYQFDLYIAFIEQGICLLNQKGVISYITPNSWLKNIAQDKIRQYVLNNIHLDIIVPNIANAFENASVDTSIFIGLKEKNTGNVNIITIKDGQYILKHSLSLEVFLNNKGYVLDVENNHETRDILNKIQSDSCTIETLFDISRGINPYDALTGQSQEIIRSKAYHANYQKDETFVPELRGRHVAPFTYKWDGVHWISYGNWLAAPRDPKYFKGERIIFREILSTRLVCALMYESFKIDRSLYIAKPKENLQYNCKFILGLLASKLFIFYVKHKFNEFDELFPKIRVAEFRQMPIPLKIKGINVHPIISLVDDIISTKLQNMGADTIGLENQLDLMVYHLYGLTYDEVLIVDPHTPIIREEYEKTN